MRTGMENVRPMGVPRKGWRRLVLAIIASAAMATTALGGMAAFAPASRQAPAPRVAAVADPSWAPVGGSSLAWTSATYPSQGGTFYEGITAVGGTEGQILSRIATGETAAAFNFNIPTPASGIAVNPSTGDLYITSGTGNWVKEYSPSGELLKTLATLGTEAGKVKSPTGITIDSAGNVYVLDSGNWRVEKFNEAGEYQSTFGAKGEANGKIFTGALGLTIVGGNLYLTEADKTVLDRVQEFSTGGTFVRAFATKAEGYIPIKVAADPKTGNLVVLSGEQTKTAIKPDSVTEWTPEGTLITTFSGPGTAEGRFSGPTGLAVDGEGDVQVTQTGIPVYENENGGNSGTGGNQTTEEFVTPHFVVPAYYGTWAAAKAQYEEICNTLPAGSDIIINPDSGINGQTEAFVVEGFKPIVEYCAAKDINSVGYVPTNYGTEKEVEVEKGVFRKFTKAIAEEEISDYTSWLPLRSIFLDNMGYGEEATEKSYYAGLKVYAESQTAGYIFYFGNPGYSSSSTEWDRRYVNVVVTNENNSTSWGELAVAPWITQSNPHAIANLIYAPASGELATAAMESDCATAASKNRAGWIFVTNRKLVENPWEHPPTEAFLKAEVKHC
jgi:hypothetical protein